MDNCYSHAVRVLRPDTGARHPLHRSIPTRRVLFLPTNGTQTSLLISQSTQPSALSLFDNAILPVFPEMSTQEHARQSHTPEVSARNANRTESILLSPDVNEPILRVLSPVPDEYQRKSVVLDGLEAPKTTRTIKYPNY